MALSASGPISWSQLNLAYGFSSNASLSVSSIRNSTSNVGLSNVSMSNFQNACIPYDGYCMNRFISSVGVVLSNASAGTTIFGNSQGVISYPNTISVPDLDYYGNEWTGLVKIQTSGTHTLQLASDDGSEMAVNNSIVATHYGAHGDNPPGSASNFTLNAGVYPFRLRQVEGAVAQSMLVSFTSNGGTHVAPSSTTTSSFMSNVTYNYVPIIKFDANDLFYRQGVTNNSTISVWSNMARDGTPVHATSLSGNSSTLATLKSDSFGYMVNFDRTKQQYFSLGNLDLNQFQSSDATPSAIKGLTFFMVVRFSSSNVGSWERIFDFGLGQNNLNLLMSRNSNSTTQFNVDLYNRLARYYTNSIDGNFHIYCFTCSNGNPPVGRFYLDGQEKSGVDRATVTGPLVNRTTTINYLARSNWASDSYFSGDIREIQIYREVLDSTTLAKMNAFLKYKWGINDPNNTNVPIMSGLVGLYTGESWNGTQWNDLSGSGNHATTTRGTINSTSVTLNSLKALSGTTTDGITFPSTILPATYTLFHVAKYNGASKGRIFNSTSNPPNWLSGFHSSKAGVAYHNYWLTDQVDIHGTNWVISTDQKTLYRSNFVARNNANTGTPNYPQLTINSGPFSGERSDWAVACVIVYNRELTSDEILQVESFLSMKYNIIA